MCATGFALPYSVGTWLAVLKDGDMSVEGGGSVDLYQDITLQGKLFFMITLTFDGVLFNRIFDGICFCLYICLFFTTEKCWKQLSCMVKHSQISLFTGVSTFYFWL